MIKKTIKINPELFKLSGNKKKTKKKKIKPKLLSSSIKPNRLKKQLIERVKAHHKRKQNELNSSKKEKDLEKFQNDFNESMNYLNSVSKKNKERREKKRLEKKNKKKLESNNQDLSPNLKSKIKETTKNYIQNIQNNTQNKEINASSEITNDTQINNVINNNSSSLIKPAPPYGILKGGSKPLYSHYRKTLKKSNLIKPVKPIEINETEKDQFKKGGQEFSFRQNKLQLFRDKMKNKISSENNKNETQEKIKKKKGYRKQKTKRLIRKVTLGKNKKNNTIGVLIKNRKTRKKIESEYKHIQKNKLTKIKAYLRKHNLIKIGSMAPENVLRPMYENAYLSGDIINKNPDILLHNYMGSNDVHV